MHANHSKKLINSISPPSLWRHSIERHPPTRDGWRQKRLRIYKRDKHRCVYCGYHSKSGLHIHHANRNPNDNRIGNLETVCAMCHLILHAGYAAEVLGILDFYAVAKYNQNDIVSLTRKLRAKGMHDKQIRIVLGLRERRPFLADPQYLAHLIGFISSRPPRDARASRALNLMYLSEHQHRDSDDRIVGNQITPSHG
jgi:hypothetical protein